MALILANFENSLFIVFYLLFYEYIAIKLIRSFDDDDDDDGALFIVSLAHLMIYPLTDVFAYHIK